MVEIERLHRGRGDAENLIRGAKQTGLENLPFREFALNAVWLELSLIAQDLIAWTQRLCLTASSRSANRKRCATGCCTPPAGSPSTPAARSCASRRTGHGPASSPPRSPGYASSHHPPADHQRRRQRTQRRPTRRRAPASLSRKPEPAPLATNQRVRPALSAATRPEDLASPRTVTSRSPTPGYCTIRVKTIPGWVRTSLVVIVISRSCCRRTEGLAA